MPQNMAAGSRAGQPGQSPESRWVVAGGVALLLLITSGTRVAEFLRQQIDSLPLPGSWKMRGFRWRHSGSSQPHGRPAPAQASR